MAEDIFPNQEFPIVRMGATFFPFGFLGTILLIDTVHAGGAALPELFVVRDDSGTGVLRYPVLAGAGFLFAFRADDFANKSGSIHCLSGHTSFDSFRVKVRWLFHC